MSISNECMILNLSIGKWSGHRLDKEATKRVIEASGAQRDAGNFNKHLVDKEKLLPVQSAATAVRQHFWKHTLPWKDNGDRVITRKALMEFLMEHEDLKVAFDEEVETFLQEVYPTEIERAEFRMGSMFDPDGFPPADRLRRKFYVQLDMDVVGTAKDFRLDIEEGEKKRLKNLTGDPELDRIAERAKKSIYGIEPKALRKDMSVRSQAAKEADEIMSDMEDLMKAFGAAA